MESRYNRPSSPRSRLVNPARSSTGTFSNPSYYDSSYYVRPSSPRTSGDRIPGSLHQTYYTSSGPSGSRTASLKYDSYSGRPRRNTDDRMIRPDISTIAPTSNTTVVPIRTHASHTHHYDRPQSPLSSSWNNRGETYITHGPSSRREHKRYYSVDDNSHSSKLVAEREIIEPRRHDTADSRGYSVTSGGRSYHQQQPITGQTNINDEGFSYTDAAGMYRDTEPAWRRPRSGSMERSSRPTSMIMERAPRSSARDLGPPPSMRGFDKIKPPRSSSIDRSREIPKYDPYPEAPSRTSSARQHYSPAIHQEPRESRRETFHEGYDRRDRDLENRRYPTADRFEDRDVAARGFGIAPGITQESHPVDRQPVWNAGDMSRSRPDDYNAPYHSSDRVDNRVPEARMPEARMPEPRIPREREPASNYTHNHASHAHNYKQYEDRPRERENNRRESNNVTPIVAGAVTGAAATIGAAEYLKSRDRERDRGERPREQAPDRDRERRKEWDERERRDRAPEQRTEDRRERERVPEDRLPPAAAAYASTQEPDRKSYDRRYEEDDRDRRSSRKPPSLEGSGDERPRHYVDRDNERRAEAAAKEAPLDPDEEYRRRIEQEAQRNGRRDRDTNDTDRERERQRRKEERNNARDVGDDRSRSSPTNISERAEPARSRYDERSNSVFDNAIVQEPESLEQPSKSVQIVAPPKEPAAPLKGILRKPTEKFPEDPDPIREGVAPHKSQNKGKDIPQGARWTRIDRRLVNPEALEEAKERFEERMDCVIVLRVLTKDEIQKLADRTKAIREAREDEYERRERRDRDRRSYRDYGDEEDRDRGDRRRDYSDYDDLESRGRDRDRDRPRMIESGR